MGLWSRKTEEVKDPRKTVVLIEDDDVTVTMIRMNLEHAGYRVEVAKNGVSGLDMVREKQPDAVVLDMQLPRMNGFEVCARIQGDEELRKIPVMVITGLTEADGSDDEEWRERLNVADFLSKPFRPTEFVERVSRMLSA